MVLVNNEFYFFPRDTRQGFSVCSPGCPGTHFVDQAGLELRNPLASASRVLGLKACATVPGFSLLFIEPRTTTQAGIIHNGQGLPHIGH